MNITIRLIVVIFPVVFLFGCAGIKEESWSQTKELNFYDAAYYAINDELKNDLKNKDNAILEYICLNHYLFKEYEAHMTSGYQIDEYKNYIFDKIMDRAKTDSYEGKTYHFWGNAWANTYSPQDEGYPIVFSGPKYFTINNPVYYYMPYNSAFTVGRGIYSANFVFDTQLILRQDKQRAKDAMMVSRDLRKGENIFLPVMIEFTINKCSVKFGSGTLTCFININKASVYDRIDINRYTEPINYLVPIK